MSKNQETQTCSFIRLDELPSGLDTISIKVKGSKERLTIIDADELDEDSIVITRYMDVNRTFRGDKGYGFMNVGGLGVKFDALEKPAGRVLGYLPVAGSDTYIAVCRSHRRLPFVAVGVVALAMVGTIAGVNLAGTFSSNTPAASDTPDIVIADGKDYNGEDINNGALPVEDEEMQYIEIPGYSTIYVNKGTYVDLVNPESNGVYFKYTITENDEVLYETDYIKPGSKVEWEAANYITGAGTHSVVFGVSTISVDSHEPCNGATFAVTAIVS